MTSYRTVVAYLVLLMGMFAHQAGAAVVYSGNAGTDGAGGVDSNNVLSFDDFVLTSDATITSFTVWVASPPGSGLDTQINNGTFSIDYAFVADAAGVPGAPVNFTTALGSGVTGGTAVDTGTLFFPNVLDFPIYEVTYDLSGPLDLVAGQVYWFGLSTAEVSPSFSWLSHADVGLGAMVDTGVGGTLEPLGHDLAFALNDATEVVAPSPLVLLLIGSGLLAIGRVRA